MMKYLRTLILFFLLLSSCRQVEVGNDAVLPLNEEDTAPRPVQIIELAAPLDRPNAEISGMAWYDDWLILLPQYPDQYAAAGSDGALFYLEKTAITEYLSTEDADPLEPVAIPVFGGDLSKAFSGYEGFEAIAFSGEEVYLTVECSPALGMKGYLMRGEIVDGKEPSITIMLDSAVEIEPQTRFSNLTDEAILIYQNEIFTFYEANGLSVNAEPVSHRFNDELKLLETVRIPNIPFRLTDVTSVDSNGRFWGVNYYFPGDTHLAGDFKSDPFFFAAQERDPELVERVIPLQILGDGEIQLGAGAPILFELREDGEARNWEGLVTFDDQGFLVVTDKFPETILGFVEYP